MSSYFLALPVRVGEDSVNVGDRTGTILDPVTIHQCWSPVWHIVVTDKADSLQLSQCLCQCWWRRAQRCLYGRPSCRGRADIANWRRMLGTHVTGLCTIICLLRSRQPWVSVNHLVTAYHWLVYGPGWCLVLWQLCDNILCNGHWGLLSETESLAHVNSIESVHPWLRQ